MFTAIFLNAASLCFFQTWGAILTIFMYRLVQLKDRERLETKVDDMKYLSNFVLAFLNLLDCYIILLHSKFEVASDKPKKVYELSFVKYKLHWGTRLDNFKWMLLLKQWLISKIIVLIFDGTADTKRG